MNVAAVPSTVPSVNVLTRAANPDPNQLTDDERQVVRALQRKDAEVRRHERAHSAAGGPYAGLPVFEFQRGPDGKLYAVSGEVSIDVSEERDPRATIAKMEIVIRAALAPAQPSAQDRAVAAQAKQIKAEAEQELKAQQADDQRAARERQEQQSGIVPASEMSKAIAAYGRTASVANDIAETAFLSISA